MKNENNNRAGVSSPVQEQSRRNVSKGKVPAKAFDKRVIVRFHSLRHRLADSDNLTGKGVLDAIVKAGILRDDSPEYVAETRHTQEKIPGDQKEKTILTIEEIQDETTIKPDF